jgi:DNA-binding NarL/FixJ family response regulator
LIVVSMVDDETLIGEVMAAGIDGFIGKNIAPDEIGQAILAIREGEVLVRFAPSGCCRWRPAPPSPRVSRMCCG